MYLRRKNGWRSVGKLKGKQLFKNKICFFMKITWKIENETRLVQNFVSLFQIYLVPLFIPLKFQVQNVLLDLLLFFQIQFQSNLAVIHLEFAKENKRQKFSLRFGFVAEAMNLLFWDFQLPAKFLIFLCKNKVPQERNVN